MGSTFSLTWENQCKKSSQPLPSLNEAAQSRPVLRAGVFQNVRLNEEEEKGRAAERKQALEHLSAVVHEQREAEQACDVVLATGHKGVRDFAALHARSEGLEARGAAPTRCSVKRSRQPTSAPQKKRPMLLCAICRATLLARLRPHCETR